MTTFQQLLEGLWEGVDEVRLGCRSGCASPPTCSSLRARQFSHGPQEALLGAEDADWLQGAAADDLAAAWCADGPSTCSWQLELQRNCLNPAPSHDPCAAPPPLGRATTACSRGW